MKLSQENGFQDIEWYRGIVSRDGSRGTWTLNVYENELTPVIRIEYENAGNEDIYEIRYTNIIPNHEDNGHYIEYRAQPNEPFNRAYDVFQGNENFLEIQWVEPTIEGRVRNLDHFGDNDWHCWDVDKKDIDC